MNEYMIDNELLDLAFYSIFLLSPLSFFSSIYLNQKIYIIFLNFCVMNASIIYWYFPIRGIRRNIDIFFTTLDMLVHYYNFIYYNKFYIIIIQLILYNLSWNTDNCKFATYYWILLHIIVHISNINLYINIYK